MVPVIFELGFIAAFAYVFFEAQTTFDQLPCHQKIERRVSSNRVVCLVGPHMESGAPRILRLNKPFEKLINSRA